MERFAERASFISLKYHKENFNYNTKCRRINPSKGEMGAVSNIFLEEINNKVNNHLWYNQQRSTSTAIECFRAIANKKASKFIKFDIAEFYPYISEELLEISMNFRRSMIQIEDKIIDIIKYAIKSLLLYNSNA